MAKTLEAWLAEDVDPIRGRPMDWLSGEHFFRDPSRPIFADAELFFPPADGVVLYARQVAPDAPLLEIKGRPFTLRDALQAPEFDRTCFVVGIFMTFYDVHTNRIPYAGRLRYRELDPIATRNSPMLPVEAGLLEGLAGSGAEADYLFRNQRVVNTVTSLDLGQSYHVLQVADYDVDCIVPFTMKQNQRFAQNERFSQIRYGSQVDLIVPASERFDLVPLVEPGTHVEGAIDPILRIIPRGRRTRP